MSEISQIVGIKLKDETARQEIETARNQIEVLTQNVNTLNNRNNLKMILIGDSYCEQNSDGDITKFYWEYLRDNLGLTQNENFFSAYQSGAGFGNGLFLTKLQSLDSLITNKSEITDILVCGGWNDSDKSQSYGTDSMYNSGITNFKNYVDTNYPNARVTIAHISWGYPKLIGSFNIYSQMPVSIERYKESCNKNGWRYLTGVEHILHRYSTDFWQTNGSHPNQGGQTLLGNSLASPFLTGSCHVYKLNSTIVSKPCGIATAINQPNFADEINGDTCSLILEPINNSGGIYITLNNSIINCDGAHQYEILDVPSEFVQGYSAYSVEQVPLYVTGTYNGTNKTLLGFADYWLDYGKLRIRPTVFENSQRVEAITAQHIWVPAFRLTLSSLTA